MRSCPRRAGLHSCAHVQMLRLCPLACETGRADLHSDSLFPEALPQEGLFRASFNPSLTPSPTTWPSLWDPSFNDCGCIPETRIIRCQTPP